MPFGVPLESNEFLVFLWYSFGFPLVFLRNTDESQWNSTEFREIPRKAMALGNSERFREFSRNFHGKSLHFEVGRIHLNFS